MSRRFGGGAGNRRSSDGVYRNRSVFFFLHKPSILLYISLLFVRLKTGFPAVPAKISRNFPKELEQNIGIGEQLGLADGLSTSGRLLFVVAHCDTFNPLKVTLNISAGKLRKNEF